MGKFSKMTTIKKKKFKEKYRVNYPFGHKSTQRYTLIMKKRANGEIGILLVMLVMLVIAVVLMVVTTIYLFGKLKQSAVPEFCLTADAVYTLSCNLSSGQVLVNSNKENLEKVMEKNNCTIKGREDEIGIIYCSQEVSNFTEKYKLQISIT